MSRTVNDLIKRMELLPLYIKLRVMRRCGLTPIYTKSQPRTLYVYATISQDCFTYSEMVARSLKVWAAINYETKNPIINPFKDELERVTRSTT
jgi:hypothetical protein